MGFKKTFFIKNLKLINWWPPFIGSGIKLQKVNKKRTRFDISLRLTSRNKNLFGTQFGGSLYAMTDPFYCFILVINLGDDFIVWDKSASVEFISPGKSKVYTTIEITETQIEEIRNDLLKEGKKTYFFETDITDKEGKVVARVKKEVYARYKKFK